MRKLLAAITAIELLLSPSTAMAEIDWSKVDSALGKKSAISGAVHRYGLPRSDLHVTLDGAVIKPGLALGGWVAFEPRGDAAMMMGDLVLTGTEVYPVMTALLAGGGVEVTGLHNHLLRASPATFYMHVAGEGDPAKLAQTVRAAETKTPFEASAAPPGEPPKLSFDAAQVDEAIGFHGKNNGGVYQFSIPRPDQINAGGMTVSPAMGTAIAVNFEPAGEGKAAISGDFVALASEVEPLLKALRSNGIEVTALHNHMLGDEPRLFFVHFWAIDEAVKLAHALRAGLIAVHAAGRR